MFNEEVIKSRMKQIREAGFTVTVCGKCSGGVRYSTMSVCPTCKGYGIVEGPPAPLPLSETQRPPRRNEELHIRVETPGLKWRA